MLLILLSKMELEGEGVEFFKSINGIWIKYFVIYSNPECEPEKLSIYTVSAAFIDAAIKPFQTQAH